MGKGKRIKSIKRLAEREAGKNKQLIKMEVVEEMMKAPFPMRAVMSWMIFWGAREKNESKK